MSMLRHNTTSILLGCILTLLLLMPFSTAAKEYGPTQHAESLWNIAKSIPHDKTVSTTQLVYAIYKLNPDAFHSDNMNELKKDTYLQLPDDMEAVSQLSYDDARKEYRTHLQNLELLQISARDLSKAKKNYKEWHRKYKSLRQQLNTSDFLSTTANAKISTQLKTAAAKQIKWKKEVRRLRKALLKKAMLQQANTHKIDAHKVNAQATRAHETHQAQKKETASIDRSQARPDNNSVKTASKNAETKPKNIQPYQENHKPESPLQNVEVDPYTLKTSQEPTNLELKLQDLEAKIEKTQSSLRAKSANQDLLIFKLQNELKASQQVLQEKLKVHARMEDRLTLLEDELGSKEQVILKLQSTLRTAANTMKHQQVENEKLQERLQTFGVSKNAATQNKRFEILSDQQEKNLTTETNNKKVENAKAVNSGLSSDTGSSGGISVLQYIIATILIALILTFIAYKLYEANRKRRFKKRMEVIELKLKPVDTMKKTASNPFTNKQKNDSLSTSNRSTPTSMYKNISE